MKQLKHIFLLALFAVLILSGCIEKEEVTYTGVQVEFDAATWNTNNAYINPPDSIAFPIVIRRPAIGRAVTTSDAALNRTSGFVQLRVNLVGAPRKQPTTVNYRVVNKNEYTLIGVASNTNEQAVAGTHFSALPGTATIPADSSFGFINFNILNTGTSSSVSRELVLMLTDNADVKASRNYKVVGLRVSQQ